MDTSNTYLQNVLRIPVPITVEMAKRTIPISEILRVAPGVLIPVGSVTTDRLTIEANGIPIAKGELAGDGNCVHIRVTEIVTSKHSATTKRAA